MTKTTSARGGLHKGKTPRGPRRNKRPGVSFVREPTLFHSMLGDLATRGREQSPPLLLAVEKNLMEHCLISFMVCKQVNRLLPGSQQHLGFANLRRGRVGGGGGGVGGTQVAARILDVIGPQIYLFFFYPRAPICRAAPLYIC